MPFQALTIARATFVESLRQPVVMILVLLSGVLQVFTTMNTGFSMGQEISGQVQGDNKLLLDMGLATVFVLSTLLAAFVATAVISREIDNKTVLTVVSKPVGRPTLVLGKFLGVTGAITLAAATMLLFLLLAIRHGVMSTAADDLDAPVLVFSIAAVALVLAVAGWGNFYYGWNFPQTVGTLLPPTLLVAYVLVLIVGKGWRIQSITHDFLPQVVVACACLLLAIVVLCAVATAASTRLGQVMTIVVCAGVFLAALLSNYLVGGRVFINKPVGVVASARPTDNEHPTFKERGDSFRVALLQAPTRPIEPGNSFYYGPSPNGYPLITPEFPPFEGPIADANALLGEGAQSRLVVTGIEQASVLIVRNAGATPLPISRPPETDDYVFLTPTRVRWPWLVAWGLIPNLHFFWLVDAVSQDRPVPASYLLTACLYALTQVGAFLALAVALFQKRDVG